MQNIDYRIKEQKLVFWKLPVLVSLTIFYILYSIFFVSPVYAHVLLTDGNIGAVLHINPEDDPIAGQQAGFFFEFKDKQGKFTPQACECTFSITKDGQEIFSQPLFQNNTDPSLQNASLFFTFPEKNIYQVKVIGKPNTPDAFQSFTIVDDVRVAREAANQNSQVMSQSSTAEASWFSTHLIHLTVGLIVGVFLVFAITKQLSNRK